MDKPVQLNIPITVSYSALESVLQQQLVGMYIPRPEDGITENPYAQVLEVGITGSRAGAYNVQLRVQLRILRTVLKRDKVDIYTSVALAYDNTTQQVYVQQFSMESATTSGFYNTALEVLVNKVAYNQIIEKARIDLKSIITPELEKVNNQLAEGLELKGLKLKGAVEAVTVQDIVPKPDGLSLRVLAQGNLEVVVQDLTSFLPLLAGKV
ncbi:DUF4403 family protein [Pontibacter sp. KCTC 32443]|uniref:DUF4403 family protein n=1 Tax=Pontibacter TaxID=323449 RepID=UPI00164E53A4|nr:MULTISPECIES: DUF4403 family protein [Pontibacter]MBC5773055.1 DUF4403 family protein [Pontibacter sp. KCTC 32443]